MRPVRLLRVLGASCALAFAAAAQPTPADSLLEYELGEVVVQEAGRGERASTLQRIGLAALDRLDVPSVAAAARLVPAAHVQTNSRGETLLYLRAAGERQVAVFFDGALLNVPWDNRVDLALVPSGVVGGITVAKGAPSVRWGANVLGGAVNLVSRALERDGVFAEATAQGGSGALAEGRALLLGHRGPVGWAAAAGRLRRGGIPLPDGGGLRFSQPDDALRTNTDTDLTHLFGRATYALGPDARLGLSLVHLDGEKGVAPEGHLDPAADRVRFWRYPLWRTTLGVLNGEAAAGPLDLRGAAWASRFRQDIAAFDSADYAVLEGGQDDEDETFGVRLVAERPGRAATLRLALNGLVSTHRQTDFAVTDGARDEGPRLTYRQRLGSAGVEADLRPRDGLLVTVGAGLDALATPETGDKPPRDALADWTASAGARYRLADGWHARASAGRKTRFPTLREQYGEALQRFALNPDLGPESAWLAEAGVEREGTRLSGEAVAFLTRTEDTIDQVTLADGRRQRVNLGRSRVVGVEVVGAARVAQAVRLDGHLTLLHARAETADGERRFLTEKPAAVGRLAATYAPAQGLTGMLEAVYTGRAYSPDADGALVVLPTALVVNARLGYRLFVARVAAEAFVRADNVTDEAVVPQLGLPGPGRELRVGLKLAL